MKKCVAIKSFVVGIIFFFAGAGVIPSIMGSIEKNIVGSNLRSGGYIQGLIDNASAGDTIYIPSGIYYENIIINKSINLIGEDKNTTIIDGSGDGDVIYALGVCVDISGFTIQNSGDYYGDSGIELDCTAGTPYNTIKGNIILHNHFGIRLLQVWRQNITDNFITHNVFGILCCSTEGSIITDNNISDNLYGIYIEKSSHKNSIIGNIISKNSDGIELLDSYDNTISGNIISDNDNGIDLSFRSISNNITSNNFLDNEQDAFFYFTIHKFEDRNRWNYNYWRQPRLLPKLIPGIFYIIIKDPTLPIEVPWFNIDWRPALKPYDIGVQI